MPDKKPMNDFINEEEYLMSEKLKTVILLDDNGATNIIHKKFIMKANCAEQIMKFQNGVEALQYIKSKATEPPDLIFVDINMPIMDGWEFLTELEKIEYSNNKKSIVILLSTSLSSAEREKANNIEIIDEVRLKPLTVKAVQEIVIDFFPNYVS